MTEDGFASFQRVEDLDIMNRGLTKKMERKLIRVGVILSDEFISGIVEEEGISNYVLQVLETLQREFTESTTRMVEIRSRRLYEEILEVTNRLRLVGSYHNGLKTEAMVNTKYKTVTKKVKHVAS